MMIIRKYLKRILTVVLSCMLLCGCYEGTEPNDIAYITAIGIDKGRNDDIEMTIQFAKPTQISGGASEEGGKGGEIIENIVVEAPTIYAGLNTANHMLSKEFSMAHMKLFVLSKKICEEGIEDILETMERSEEVRPNIYMAVAEKSAKEYLESIKPVVEINPVKYYQLVFEKNNFGNIPKNSNHDFYFYYDTMEKNNVLPLAGVAQIKESAQGQESQGGSEGEGEPSDQEQSPKKESGGQQQQTDQEKQSESEKEAQSGGRDSGTPAQDKNQANVLQQQAPINYENFEYRMKDYIAGNMGIEKENKSEIMGMAVFRGDKMVGTMGSIESVLYNMLSGLYQYGYVTFKEPDSQQPITVSMEQEKKPRVTYDKKNQRVSVELFLEGALASLSAQKKLEHDINRFEMQAAHDIEDAAKRFLYRTSRDFNADVIGIGKTVKKKFWTYQKFKEYNWDEKYQSTEFDVKANFKIRKTGLTIRTEE